MSPAPDLSTDEAREALRRIDSGEVLGATRQLLLLGDCLLALARSRTDEATLQGAVSAVVEHVAVSRGESSQAVIHGLRLMAVPAITPAATAGSLPDRIEASVGAFRTSLQAGVTSLQRHATGLLSTRTTFLAYDYSSTVSRVLTDLRRSGSAVTVFLPEARSLDGGIKYLADWRGLGIVAHLLPDAALGWALSQCDIALAGAETLSLEGGCYNTIGTAVTAHEAHRINVPFYVLSILLKTDPATPAGERLIPMLDFASTRSLASEENGEGVEVHGDFPDLDYTPPTVITGIITEAGVLEPSQIAEATSSMLNTGAATYA